MKPAGFYRHDRVTILTRGEATMGDRGQEEGEYKVGETYWGRVIWFKGRIRQQERTNDSEAKGTLYLRHHDGIDSDTRFRINGKDYRQVETPIIEQDAMEIQTVIAEIQ